MAFSIDLDRLKVSAPPARHCNPAKATSIVAPQFCNDRTLSGLVVGVVRHFLSSSSSGAVSSSRSQNRDPTTCRANHLRPSCGRERHPRRHRRCVEGKSRRPRKHHIAIPEYDPCPQRLKLIDLGELALRSSNFDFANLANGILFSSQPPGLTNRRGRRPHRYHEFAAALDWRSPDRKEDAEDH